MLSAEREKFQPENIGAEISYQDRWVEIAPTLFNRKDYVQFKVLLDGFEKMEVDARIVGAPAIEKVGVKFFTIELFAVIVVAIIMFSAFYFLASTNPNHDMALMSKISAIFVVIMTLTTIIAKFLVGRR